MNGDLIPCLGFLGFFLMLFAFIAFNRYLAYRETIALAEKGLVRPERLRGDGKGALRWGILSTALGLALCAGWVIAYLSVGRDEDGFALFALIGLFPTFFGLALILIYVLTREDRQPERKSEAAAPAELPKAE